jgi:hypothetical protein
LRKKAISGARPVAVSVYVAMHVRRSSTARCQSSACRSVKSAGSIEARSPWVTPRKRRPGRKQT